MSERFFSSSPIVSDRVTLDGPEAHHLLHVMRLPLGQCVRLFDGSGAEFDAVVHEICRSHAVLKVIERRLVERELPFPLAVGVALPKGDRQKRLVEKLTELGATALVPLATERAVAQPTAAALERLRRSVIEAAKQCGRNRLMHIATPQTWPQWLSNAGIAGDERAQRSAEQSPRRLVAHSGGAPVSHFNLTMPLPTDIAVGPEGGLTDAEITAARDAGWQTVDLGPRILRVETAAVALTSAIILGQRI
jgi:16S rRNA (uracil1498-N3)-methyltransferase